MDKSEDQFQTLLANLIPRVNKALKNTNKVDAIGLLLYGEDEVEVYLSIIDDSIGDALTTLQNQMVEIVRKKSPVASCLAYPNYEAQQIIALLENHEHYTLEASIPVKSESHLHLDVENLTTNDGEIYLFGETP